MNHLKKFNEGAVEEFIDLYKNGDYSKAANIQFRGWGDGKDPLSKEDNIKINKYIKSTSKNDQEEFESAMRGVSGTFS